MLLVGRKSNYSGHDGPVIWIQCQLMICRGHIGVFTWNFHLAAFEVLFQYVLYVLLGQKSYQVPSKDLWDLI